MRIITLSLVLLLTTSMGTAFAEDKTVDTVPEGAEVKIIENPKMEKVKERAEELASKLSPSEINNLAVVRDGFGMIRSVGIAHETVKEASSLCSKENPDLAESIDARFSDWDKAISGALEEQESKMNAAIAKPYFDTPKDIKAYLGAIDDAAEYAESNIDKQLITSADACKNLRDSMDGTQDTITKLLGEIKWPGSEAPETQDTSADAE